MNGLPYWSSSFLAVLFCLQVLLVSVSSLGAHSSVRRHINANSHAQKLVASSCLTYNFKHPHHCSPPDCEFVVTWVDTNNGSINFTLLAHVAANSSVWAAVGFSNDPKMPDTDVIACWAAGSHQQIHDGWIQPQSRIFTQDVEQELVYKTINNFTLTESKLLCRFSRQKTLGSDVTLVEDKNLTQPLHILLASGHLMENTGSGYSMLAHTRAAASTCVCDVTDCQKECVCVNAFKLLLLKLHGVIMTIAFVFFLPTGALVSRYFKIVFPHLWFRAHVALMVIAILFGLTGLGLILGHTGGTFSVGIHQIVGVICLSLSVVQPLVGIIRPPVGPTVRRTLFNIFHRIMATLILSLGTVALFWGAFLYNSTKIIWMMATLGLSVITNLGFMLLLEFLTRTQKFSNAATPPVGYHKVTKHDELSESEEEVFVRDLPSKLIAKNFTGKGHSPKQELYGFEQGLLILFIIQTFCFAAIFSSLIYFYDSSQNG